MGFGGSCLEVNKSAKWAVFGGTALTEVANIFRDASDSKANAGGAGGCPLLRLCALVLLTFGSEVFGVSQTESDRL